MNEMKYCHVPLLGVYMLSRNNSGQLNSLHTFFGHPI